MEKQKKNLVQKIKNDFDLRSNYNLEPYRKGTDMYKENERRYMRTKSKIILFAQKNIIHLENIVDNISNIRNRLCYGVIYNDGDYIKWHDTFDKFVDLLEKTRYPEEFLGFVRDISAKVCNKSYGYKISQAFNSIDGGAGDKAETISRASENLIDIENQPYVDGKYLNICKEIGKLLYNFDHTNISDVRMKNAAYEEMNLQLPSQLFIKYISNLKEFAIKHDFDELKATKKRFTNAILKYGKNAEAIISTELEG